jgi:hypothetical protein
MHVFSDTIILVMKAGYVGPKHNEMECACSIDLGFPKLF